MLSIATYMNVPQCQWTWPCSAECYQDWSKLIGLWMLLTTMDPVRGLCGRNVNRLPLPSALTYTLTFVAMTTVTDCDWLSWLIRMSEPSKINQAWFKSMSLSHKTKIAPGVYRPVTILIGKEGWGHRLLTMILLLNSTQWTFDYSRTTKWRKCVH